MKRENLIPEDEPQNTGVKKKKILNGLNSEIAHIVSREEKEKISQSSDDKDAISENHKSGESLSDNRKEDQKYIDSSQSGKIPEKKPEKTSKDFKAEIKAARRKESLKEVEEWNGVEVIRKQSRVDQHKFQAVVEEEKTGKIEHLAKAAEAICTRCKFHPDEESKVCAIDEFTKFVRMFEEENTHNTLSGPWLNGSNSTEQLAMDVLHSVNYSLVKAKFCLLFPSLAQSKPNPLVTMSEESIQKLVNTALNGMLGYRKEERGKYIDQIMKQINTTGIESSELYEYFAMFKKQEWDIPVELEAQWLKVHEVSANFRKQFEHKIPYDLLQEKVQAITKEKIRTPEIRQALEYAEKSKAWTEKAQNIQKKWVTMKTLQRLVNEAKNLPVKLPLYEEVKERFEKAHECITNLYKFIKNSKTRTSTNSEKCTAEEIEKVIRIAQDIKFANPDVEKQKEYLDTIKEWENRVRMTFEDPKQEKTPELVTKLLSETLEFKFSVQLIGELEEKMSSCKWLSSVNKELVGCAHTRIKILQGLINEGQTHNYDIEKREQLKNVLDAALNLKAETQKVLKREKILEVEVLEDLYKKMAGIKVEMKEKGKLAKLVADVRAWRARCEALLKSGCQVSDLEIVKKNSETMKVTCKEYEDLCINMQPVLQWLEKSTKFIGKFSAELTNGKVTLTAAQQIDQSIASLKKKNSPTKHLFSLLEEQNEIVHMTPEYKHLGMMKEKLAKWEESAKIIIGNYLEKKIFSRDEIMELLRQGFYFPTTKEIGLQLLDICEHQKWITRANDAIKSKVPVHILEGIIRDGNGFTVNTLEIAEIVKKLETKVVNAKQWMGKYKQLKSDPEKRKEKQKLTDLEAILKEGEQLNVKIREIDWLSGMLTEVKKTQLEVHEALKGKVCFTKLEELRNTLEDYDIEIEEQKLLIALYKVCSAWSRMTMKIIKSRCSIFQSVVRQLDSKLTTSNSGSATTQSSDKEEVLLIVNKEENFTYTLHSIVIGEEGKSEKNNARFPRANKIEYCICRSSDDKTDMIACDICNDWFHLTCINLTKEASDNFPYFICFACMKRKDKAFYYPESLDNIQRISETEYDHIIKEGNKLPVEFTELKALEEVKLRMEEWKVRATNSLSKGVQFEMYAEEFENKREKPKKDRERDTEKIENDLMKLYLESQSFPVEIDLSKDIMKLVKQKDWTREALSCKYTKFSTRKYKQLMEQAASLNIEEEKHLSELLNDIQNLNIKHQKIYSTTIMDDGNRFAGIEDKKEIKLLENPTQMAIELANALRNKNELEYNIVELTVRVVKENNPRNAPLIEEAHKVLGEAQSFRKKAKEYYTGQNLKPEALEYILRCSLSLGCIPDNVI